MKRKIPEKVFVRTDTESSPTPIDLTNPWCIRSLRKLVEVSSQWVIFEEMLPNEEDELFESSDKNYVVEIDGIFKKVQNRKL